MKLPYLDFFAIVIEIMRRFPPEDELYGASFDWQTKYFGWSITLDDRGIGILAGLGEIEPPTEVVEVVSQLADYYDLYYTGVSYMD